MGTDNGLPGQNRRLRIAADVGDDTCRICGSPLASHPRPKEGQPPESACLALKDSTIAGLQARIDESSKTFAWLGDVHRKELLEVDHKHKSRLRVAQNDLAAAESQIESLQKSAGKAGALWRRLHLDKPLSHEDRRLICAHPDVVALLDKVWKDGYENGKKREQKCRIIEERSENGEPYSCTCFLGHPPCGFCESLSEEEVYLLDSDISQSYTASPIAKSIETGEDGSNEQPTSAIDCTEGSCPV